ncbi:hypothetical protein AB0H36_33960 [Kribbella sp. NPDC050820]|uniref:hypothetical protein n=1 Tax=Kribbella sp. NPDC050820 TaxID=3155408 RepID=UPI0033F26178
MTIDDAYPGILRSHWGLTDPITLKLAPRQGGNSVLFDVRPADSPPLLAKLALTGRVEFEAGLIVAERVNLRSNVQTSAPLRTADGAVSVMAPYGRLVRPLAVMQPVHGEPVPMVDDSLARPLARLLAKVHCASKDFDGPMRRADDLNLDMGMKFEDEVRPVVSAAFAEVRSLEQVTWGACYNDEPDLFRDAEGELGLVDWGSVTFAPLLWDVLLWADFFSGRCRDLFLETYLDEGPITADEMAHSDVLQRFSWASNLKFCAFRLAHPSHYGRYTDHDAENLAMLLRRLVEA